MKLKWYGDKRDLVKWSVLITLAKKKNIKKIVYAAYLGKDEWPLVEIDTEKTEIPKEVLRNFRCLEDIGRMEGGNLRIVSIEDLFFNEERPVYREKVINSIQGAGGQIILFLDPDTGLEPLTSQPNGKHVTKEDIYGFWNALRKDSFLVIYQHDTNKKGDPWVELKRTQLSKYLKIDKSDISIGKSFGIAKDVVFFIAKK